MWKTKFLFWLLFIPSLSQSQTKINALEAAKHIGDQATVCGNVASTRYASSTRGEPTFLNLEKPYPKQVFTVVIWGRNRAKFGTPEAEYRNKRICVTGTIEDYRGVPQVEARQPSQITIEKN